MSLPARILNGIRFGVLALCFSIVLSVTGMVALVSLGRIKVESFSSPETISDITSPEELAVVPPSQTEPEVLPASSPIALSQTVSNYLPQYLYTAKPFTQIGGAIGGVLNVILDTFSIDTKYFTLKSLNSIDISGSLVDIGDGKYNRANGDKDLGVAGDFEARGSAEIAGTLYIGTDSGSGDDRLYFDDGASQYLMWDEDPGRFYFSNGLELAGDMRIGTGSIGNTDYLFFDDGKSQYLAWDDANDRFVLTNDLVPSTDDAYDLGSSSQQWRNLYVDGTAYLDAVSIDSLSLVGNITMPDDSWIGLGAAKGRLIFDDASTDLLSFLSTNVGIGTSTPGYQLEVNGSGLFTTLGVGATSPNYTLYTSGTFGVGSTAYFASNVGIGTTLPGYKLEVNGTLGVGSTAYFASSVGIGTVAPGSRLEVEAFGLATDGQLRLSSSFGYEINTSSDSRRNVGNIEFFSNDLDVTAVVARIGAIAEASHSSSTQHVTGLGFYVSPSGSASPVQSMRLTGAGNLGIGTTTPGYKLEVNGSGLFTTLGVGATSPNYTLYTSGTFGVGSTAYFASNVGIGTTLPAYKLDIAGSLNLSTGNSYYINGNAVLGSATLGSGVLASSLTSVGALTGGSIASGFGTISTLNTITGTTLNGTTGINTGATAGTQRIDSTGNLLNIGNLTLSGAISGGTTYSGSGNITSTAGLLSISGAGNNYLAGNLGIGTTLPGAKLEIAQTDAANDEALVLNTEETTGTQSVFNILSDFNGDETSIFNVDASGSTIIGARDGNDKARALLTTYGDTTMKGKIDQITSGMASVNDVYVYDTTKDSDEGKWRNDERAKNSSWYNETLDATGASCNPTTNDRCGIREFPSKAILVATSSYLYIYDAKDNTMWMRFDQNAGSYIIGADTNNNPSSVFALNGKIYLGANGSVAEGLYVLDLIKDGSLKYNATDDYIGNKTLANRNAATTYSTGPSAPIVNATVNDVHGAVINGKTYVAVATDGGVSVINETDKTVVNFTDASQAGNYTNSVAFDASGSLYFTWDTASSTQIKNLIVVYKGNSKWSTGSTDIWDTESSARYSTNFSGQAITPWIGPVEDAFINKIYVTSGTSTVDGKSNTIYVATSGGLSVVQEKQGDETNGSVKYYNSSEITEEMVGDIRGMWSLNETTLTDGATIDDKSVNDADLQVVSGATSASGVRGKGLTFNGSTQYLKQQVIDDQVGSSWGPTVHGLSLAPNAAFMRVQGVDLSPYASAGNDYMIVVSDGEGDKAWGYIDTADVAEALGSDLFDAGAGVFTSGTYGWVAYGTNTIENDAGVLKVTYVDNAQGAFEYLGNATDLSSDLTVGKLYKLTFDAKVGAGNSVGVYYNDQLTGSGSIVTVTETDFTSKTIYFTAGHASLSNIRFSGMDAGEIIWLDNLILKEVTDVGIDGVHIMSTKGGSTQSWAGISASFNYNASAYTFEVRETEFQITGNLTVGAWVKTSDAAGYFISKYKFGNDGYVLGHASGSLRFFVYGSTDSYITYDGNTDDDQWHHLVGTYDGTNIKLYIDGISVAGTVTGTVPATIIDVDEKFYIGAENFSQAIPTASFAGTIDEPFVTAEALTPAQIKHMYEVGKRALDEHTASRVTGMTDADTYQQLQGTATVATAVTVDDSNQYIYVGTQGTGTGALTVLGVDSDSVVDVFNTGNTTKIDDSGTQYSVLDVKAVSVTGTPIHPYNSGTTTGDNSSVLAVIGDDSGTTGDRAWMQSGDISLYSTLATLTSPNLTKDTLTVNNIFKVFNTYNNLADATTGETIQTPAFSVDSSGNLVYNYLSPSTSATALDFNIPILTTGTAFDLTADAITTGTGMALSVDGLTSGKGLDITSSSIAMTGSMANLSLSGNNAANTGSILNLETLGASAVAIPLYVKNYGAGLSMRVDDVSGDTSPFVIDASGNVGIGTTAPGASLHAIKASGTVAIFNRTTDDGTIVSLQQAGVEEGTISVSDTTVSYNAFTGSHYALSSEETERGWLVSATGINTKLHNNENSEVVYGVVPTSLENDPMAFGIYLSKLEPSKEVGVDNPELIASLGNMDLWVVDSGEDIKAGDYLISSNTKGHAIKDNKVNSVSYIIAQAMEDISWAGVEETISDTGTKHKKISVLIERMIVPNGSSVFTVETRHASSLQDDLKDFEIAQSLTVQQNLTVLGVTSLNTLSVAGQTIFSANMIFSDDGQSIDTLVGDLKLQPLAKAGIDLFAGKVVFDVKGNITTLGEITASKLNIKDAAGSVIIPSGKVSFKVISNKLTDKSLIFVSAERPVTVGSKKISVDEFEVTLEKAESSDLKVSYWVIN